ncbi:MAG: hypothetical protein WC467_00970 [Patescibacteria group bacterium]
METETLNQTESCLRFLPEASGLPIKALDGKRILSDATDVFKKFISGSLLIRGLNNPGKSTPATLIAGREISGDATFIKMFDDFKRPLKELLLTQDQICEFNKIYPGFLSKTDANFFLFRRDKDKPAIGDNLFVACVTVTAGGLIIQEEAYTDSFIWCGDRKLRVFVPMAA